MDAKRLYVSFWSICLGNLPEGSFTHRRIPASDAKLRIDQARGRNALLCLSDDDLLASYRKHERDNHHALCRVLIEHFDIDLPFKDFCTNDGNVSDLLYNVNALGWVQLTNSNELLLILCSY